MESTTEQLDRLRSEIQYHRKKAADYRRRAETQDRFADEKVKLCAELGTGELPLLSGSESKPPYTEGTDEDPRASVAPDGTVRMD